MIIPIRCFTCGKVVANKWQTFQNKQKEGIPNEQIFKDLDIKRYCPRIICVEISPLVDKKIENYKESKVYKYLLQNGYKLIWKGSNSFIFLFQPKQQSI